MTGSGRLHPSSGGYHRDICGSNAQAPQAGRRPSRAGLRCLRGSPLRDCGCRGLGCRRQELGLLAGRMFWLMWNVLSGS